MSKSPTLKCYCGKAIEKATRIFGGVAYCRSCYAKEFDRRPCVQCGGPARLHSTEDSGLCRKCEIAARKCLRCSKPVARAALRIAEGVVCPGCRRHFPPYPKPQDRSGHSTCSGCHRHRKPVIWTLARKPLCARCIDEDNVEIARIQQENYWISAAVRRCRDAAAEIESAWHRDLAKEFCVYLIGEIGPEKAAMQAERQIAHVGALVRRFPRPKMPSKSEVLTSYTGKDIKQAELFFRFLKTSGCDLPTRVEVDEENERRRIENSLARLVGNDLFGEVEKYRDHLNGKASISQKSIRLSVHSAVSFSVACGGDPTNEALGSYLKTAPGQRNALYGFISHLIRAGYDIEAPKKKEGRLKKPRFLDVDQAIEAAHNTSSTAELRSLTAALLTIATGVSLIEVTQLPSSALRKKADGKVALEMLDLRAVIELPIAALVTRYLESLETEGTASKWLFPGRPEWEPLSVATVAYHLQKWDLSIESMGRMARRNNKKIAAERRLKHAIQPA